MQNPQEIPSRPESSSPDDLEPRPVTVLELAAFRLGRSPDGEFSGADLEAAGLALLGGCAGCHASIAAYNAHPSRSGYWKCSDCIGGDGWSDVAECNAAVFPS